MPSSPGLSTRESADIAPFDSDSCGDVRSECGPGQWRREWVDRITRGSVPSAIGQPFERAVGGGLRGRGRLVELGWGVVGRVRTRRQLEVGEDGAHDRRILDGGDDAQLARARRTDSEPDLASALLDVLLRESVQEDALRMVKR